MRALPLYHFLYPLLFISLMACENKSIPAEVKPNVLLIMTDDQGWGDLSFHGNDSIFTPNIDDLARQSCQFDRFFVSPVCAPTRASLLTGRYHLRTGTSWVTHRKEVMRSEELTLAELLKNADYKTGLFGKWHNGEQYPNDPKGQGFDEFFGFAAGHWNNYFNTTLTHNDQKVKTEGFITDALTDKAIAFIETAISGNDPKPFFSYLAYNAPHSPFQVPDKYFDKYKKMGLTDKNAAVYGMVENIDDNIGRLIKTLEKENVLDNTIIVFLTDNGPNGHRFNGGMRGIKGKVHEGGVRVPCFIRWKNQLPENQLILQNAAHIDLLPTLAELCKIDIPEDHSLDGVSLVSLLINKNAAWSPRNIYTIHTEGEMRLKPGAVRTDQYRMVIDYDGKPHLFDMHKDPGEQNDIAGQYPQLLDSLKTDFENWFQEVTQNGIEPPPVQIGHRESLRVSLPAPEAKLQGGTGFKGGRGWANDYIINWKLPQDKAIWEVDVITAGEYEVALKYNCSSEYLPASFEISIGENKKLINIEKEADFQFIASPDKVLRGEVYEKVWEVSEPIVLELKKGKYNLELELKQNHPEGWLEIKEVEIHRMSKQ